MSRNKNKLIEFISYIGRAYNQYERCSFLIVILVNNDLDTIYLIYINILRTSAVASSVIKDQKNGSNLFCTKSCYYFEYMKISTLIALNQNYLTALFMIGMLAGDLIFILHSSLQFILAKSHNPLHTKLKQTIRILLDVVDDYPRKWPERKSKIRGLSN